MEEKLIIAFVIIGMYLIILLIVGICAWLYHLKHRPFQISNQAYKAEIDQIMQTWSGLEGFKPIKNVFSTKPGENIYLVDEIEINCVKLSKHRQTKFDDNDLDVETNYFGIIKSNYQLFAKRDKTNFANAIVYLSNKRIVFEENQKFQTIKLTQIISTEFVLLYYLNTYQKAFVIRTKHEAYQIITNNITLGLLVNLFISKDANEPID